MHVLIKKWTKSFELEFRKSAAKGLFSLEILSFKPLYDPDHIAKETAYIKKPSHINKLGSRGSKCHMGFESTPLLF